MKSIFIFDSYVLNIIKTSSVIVRIISIMNDVIKTNPDVNIEHSITIGRSNQINTTSFGNVILEFAIIMIVFWL